VLIIVGARSKEDVRVQFKKQHVNFKTSEKWLGSSHLDWLLKQEAGSIHQNEDLCVIYLFKEWKDTPYWQKVLVHEVSHMVDSIAEAKNLDKETEARAYLSEYLFDTIRKSL